MLLQAYDFLELHRRYGVTLQIGGSDQWGNITAGTDLVRRTHGRLRPRRDVAARDAQRREQVREVRGRQRLARPGAHVAVPVLPVLDQRRRPRCVEVPAVFHADGARGRSRRWTAPSPSAPESREAQAALAFDVTSRVHGDEAARTARDVSRSLFDRKADPRSLSPAALQMLRDEIPFRRLAAVRDVVAGTASNESRRRCSTCSSRPAWSSRRAKRDDNCSRAQSPSTAAGWALRNSSSVRRKRSLARTT